MSTQPQHPDEELIQQAMTRFDEACAYQRAIHCLRLRPRNPSLTAEQQAQRQTIIQITISLLQKARDELLDLGIYEYQRGRGKLFDPTV